MALTVKPKRVRSPAYPSVDLETAIEKGRGLYDFAKRSSVPISSMLPRWGYESGASANGMKLVAALKSYGLVSDSGQKAQRQIAITDRMFTIIHALKDSVDYVDAIQSAALSPPIYQYLYDKYGHVEKMPHEEAVQSHLILEKKFNEAAVKGILADYKATLVFSRVGDEELEEESDDDEVELDEVEIPEVGDLVQWESGGVFQFPEARKILGIQEDEDINWVFVEGSNTGIPMHELIVEKKGGTTPPQIPQTLLASTAVPPERDESQQKWLSGRLSKTVGYSIYGTPSEDQIDALIKVLIAQKAVLAIQSEEES